MGGHQRKSGREGGESEFEFGLDLSLDGLDKKRVVDYPPKVASS